VTAANHALTGALIGLTVTNPWLALPLAFVSHFVCDAIPHYDMKDTSEAQLIGSKRFVTWYILVPGAVCALIVAVLAAARPAHWLLAAICAFVAASPDLFWAPRFLYVRRTGKDRPLNAFLRFHAGLQWLTGPRLIWVEAVWFVVFAGLLVAHL